jgi:putative transposase
MQWLQTTFTVRFNRRHKAFGHLFAGRYKAIPVQPDETYFASLIEYIHLNPARAGLVSKGQPVATYPWSSLPHYLVPAKRRPKFLVVERALGVVDCKDTAAGRRRYSEGMDRLWKLEMEGKTGGSVVPSVMDAIKTGWFYGSTEFKEMLLEKAEELLQSASKDRTRAAGAPQDHGIAIAEQITEKGLGLLGVDEAQLSSMKKGAPEKVAVAWHIRRRTSVRLQWIADRLEMGNVGNVSVHCSRVDQEDYRSKSAISLVQKLSNNL